MDFILLGRGPATREGSSAQPSMDCALLVPSSVATRRCSADRRTSVPLVPEANEQARTLALRLRLPSGDGLRTIRLRIVLPLRLFGRHFEQEVRGNVVPGAVSEV